MIYDLDMLSNDHALIQDYKGSKRCSFLYNFVYAHIFENRLMVITLSEIVNYTDGLENCVFIIKCVISC